MSDADDTGDDIVELLGETRQAMLKLQRRVAYLERYLRDEGYGPEDLDEDGDDD